MTIYAKNHKLVHVLDYTTCTCGAVTLRTDYGTYSCARRNLKEYFPRLDLRRVARGGPEMYCCNHCVNHYGLDLCGSGECFGHCDNDCIECKKPMQVIGEYERVLAKDSLCFG